MVTLAGQTVQFIDALAANDPDSTAWLWEHYVGYGKQAVVLLNCRPDRKLRTVQLCELLGTSTADAGKSIGAEIIKPLASSFILTGDVTFAKHILQKQNYPETQIFTLAEAATPDDLAKIVAELVPKNTATAVLTIFAAGNIKGLPAALPTLWNGG